MSLYTTHFGNEGIELLAQSDLLSQLKTLTLEHGSMTNDGIDALCAVDLSHLDSLNLSGNYLSAAGIKRLKQHYPGLIAKSQLTGDPDDEHEHLFYGDIE